MPLTDIPREWLRVAAVEFHNDGRERLEDFDGDFLACLDDALTAVVPLILGRNQEKGGQR